MLRLATRTSRLALIQTQQVQDRLEKLHPGLGVLLVKVVTSGDRIVDVPLEGLKGVGFFTDALEQALAEGKADAAVHSLKDVPVEMAAGFEIGAVLEREDPRDVIVSVHGGLAALPEGAVVGTDSSRRSAQILLHRPDLRFRSARGNVPTRLDKLNRGEYDALVLAAAGLNRLGLGHLGEALAVEVCLPAPGQGAIAVETVAGSRVLPMLRGLDHGPTAAAVTAERAVLAGLGGGCQTPLGALATVNRDRLVLDAAVAAEGAASRVHLEGPVDRPGDLGQEAARRLLERARA